MLEKLRYAPHSGKRFDLWLLMTMQFVGSLWGKDAAKQASSRAGRDISILAHHPVSRLRLVGVRTVRGEWFVLISVLLSLQPTYSEPGTETIQQERTGRRDGTPSSLTQTLHLHSKWVMKYHVNDTFSCISYNLLTASHFRSWLLQEVRLGLCWLSAGWGLVWKSRCMWGCLYPDLLPSYTICIISYVWRLPQETCVNHFNKVRL